MQQNTQPSTSALSSVTAKANAMKDYMTNAYKNTSDDNRKAYGVILIIVLIWSGIFMWLMVTPKDGFTNKEGFISFFKSKTVDVSNCNNSNFYNKSVLNNNISSINTIEKFSYTFKDYYIKSAFNCCCIGAFKNSYVSTCMLKHVLRQGVRCLDFEIYSLDNEPIVATTSLKNNTKQSYNYIQFSEIMNVLSNCAFASTYSPNPDDPLIIHLRINSSNVKMFEKMTDIIKNYGSLFLGPEYSWAKINNENNEYKNFGNIPLLKLKKKIILIIKSNDVCKDDTCKLYEYVNIVSGGNSIIMHEHNFFNVKNTPSAEELITFNKTAMTFVLPDLSTEPININFGISDAYGCQMTCMCFQLEDSKLIGYNKMFNDEGTAFILKPEELREKLEYIADPIPQNPAYSYAPRIIKARGPAPAFEM